MPDIQGQRLFVNQSGLLQTQRTVEETVEQINIALRELREVNNQLFRELRGELMIEFRDTMQYIEANVEKTKNMLQATSQEMQWYGNQFMQINSNAERHAGGTNK